jgi:outer membrane protein assembly factor BamD (BamD/ComL family)
MQREAVVSVSQRDDDKRLFSLIRNSSDFDRIARTRIFLGLFSRSPLRPEALLLLGEAAEEAAGRLSRDATRRLANLDFTYYLNYTSLDRYNRQGIRFVFNRSTRQFHYDGAAWRELIRKYPTSPEAIKASQRMEQLVTARP